MHIHKFEKIWITFGVTALLVFLTTLGVSAFYIGNQPPSCLKTVDPEKLSETAPFNKPGLTKIGENEYNLTIVSQAFAYTLNSEQGKPTNEIEIPVGATVHISVATKDVIHGFEIAGSNANMMVEPGYISEVTQTFKKPGEFLLLCNEYCGSGHHLMSGKIKVVE